MLFADDPPEELEAAEVGLGAARLMPFEKIEPVPAIEKGDEVLILAAPKSIDGRAARIGDSSSRIDITEPVLSRLSALSKCGTN